MNTCDTCKHWAGEQQSDMVLLNDGFKECLSPKIWTEHKGGENEAPDTACAAAGDYRKASFSTGPKFGCLHWEPKS